MQNGSTPAPPDEFNGMMKAWAESGWLLVFRASWMSYFLGHNVINLLYIAYLTYIALHLIIVIIAY